MNKREWKACNSDLVNTYATLEPSSILTFSTLDDDEHIDTGCHVMLPENECVYETIRRQWAATVTFVKGKSQKISDSQYHPESTVQQEARQGWALRKQKATGRISPAVNEYLTQVFKIMKVQGWTLKSKRGHVEPATRKVSFNDAILS